MSVALLSAGELEAITTVAQARIWAGLADNAWRALNTVLGGVDHLRVLAYIPPVAIRTALRAARVPTEAVGDPGDANHVPAGEREFTAVEGAQVGLLYQVALAKLGRPLVDPLTEPNQVAPGGGGGAVPTPPGTQAPNPSRKVKNSQVLDQADEGEIPELSQTTVEEHYKVLRKAKGGPVRPEAEPSPDQISAMKVRVLDLELPPYADFAIFVNFQGRFSRTLKFLNHILQPEAPSKLWRYQDPQATMRGSRPGGCMRTPCLCWKRTWEETRSR